MMRGVFKGVILGAATAVIVPYTTAFLCNIFMGWPQRKHRFRRAFSPRKVYALNYAILQKLIVNLRYLPLFVQWKIYYKMASAKELIKDIPFGRNDKMLDLYFPQPESHKKVLHSLPVLVFVYDSDSGDKSMYGLLGSAVSNTLGVILCCPNYSRYPQDIPFGRNDKTMDLYIPKSQPRTRTSLRPVLVFVYGGAWGSGDKNMYCLLCSAVANKLGVIVSCPNYSTFPQGYVDDMVQDVVDCVSWIYENIHSHGGDKNKIMLVGHSAGAHLCAMALLELLHDELAESGPDQYQPIVTRSMQFDPAVAASIAASMQFEEGHYRGNGEDNSQEKLDVADESSGSSGSFCVVTENDDRGSGLSSLNDNEDRRNASLDSSSTASTFEVVGGQNTGSLREQGQESLPGDTTNKLETGAGDAEAKIETREEAKAENVRSAETDVQIKEKVTEQSEVALTESAVGEVQTVGVREKEAGVEVEKVSGVERQIGEEEEEEEESGDDESVDSVITVRPKDIEHHPSLIDLRKSIKAFVGIAGVYHIGDHYRHETYRGVEDVSSMARAMYGEDHFDRFSPTAILASLHRSLSLPKIVILHGTKDYVAPVSTSSKFAAALKDKHADFILRIIPNCDHFEICLDLMKRNRKFHKTVMDVLSQTAKEVF